MDIFYLTVFKCDVLVHCIHVHVDEKELAFDVRHLQLGVLSVNTAT